MSTVRIGISLPQSLSNPLPWLSTRVNIITQCERMLIILKSNFMSLPEDRPDITSTCIDYTCRPSYFVEVGGLKKFVLPGNINEDSFILMESICMNKNSLSQLPNLIKNGLVNYM